MAKTGDYEIPFHPLTGDQMHYPDPYLYVREGAEVRKLKVDWRENHEFSDTLTYKGFERGRSAAYLVFERASGGVVTMFMKEADEVIPRMAGGHITGRFTFIKRGQNFGCRVLPLA
jgi:hypothetical protein